VVTRKGAGRAPEIKGHCFDEARLAAAGRPLEEHRKTASERRTKDLFFICHRQVVRARRRTHAVTVPPLWTTTPTTKASIFSRCNRRSRASRSRRIEC